MSQPSAIQRPRTKLWQFSVAHLLIAVALVAVTCGAFRLDLSLGVGALHFMMIIVITAVRTRASLRHHEALWNALDLPGGVRKDDASWLVLRSVGVAIAGCFFFHLAAGVAFIPAFLMLVLAIEFWPLRGTEGVLGWIFVAVVLAAGTVGLLAWLLHTWPRSYFLQSVPSDKTT